ncbi:hypothetical protein EQG49_05240 [Periweissella cryptocerci]|uniref:MucBP domain-containing protein n=1 Tax=Periweissella cryptocerci TaxID=2506420 RepID=A0A4P6YT42_9LACO|nr:leucine-rich repeat protein [Periweissella cryptocerci]QBO35904.1 hypothetical protein EQG49_05240 [Periweissella cryptocerci]
MTNDKELHHNFYRITEHLNGKHFLYAGLATTTLIGGMGATPIALADKPAANATELVTTAVPTKTKTKNKRYGSSWSDTGQAYNFTAADFVVEHGVITGMDDSFFETVEAWSEYSPWNGEITFPAEFATTIKGIGPSALSMEALTAVDINSLTALEFIGDGAFSGAYYLEKIDLSNLQHLKKIGNSAFGDLGGATSITLNNLPNLTTIDDYAFAYSMNWGWMDNVDYSGTITLTNLPKLTSIGSYALGGCEHLTSVTLDGLDSLKVLPEDLLSDNPELTNVTLNNLPKVQRIEDTFLGNTALQTLTLTNMPDLIYIGRYVYDANERDDDGYGAFNQLIVGNLNSALTVEENAFEMPHPGGIVIPLNGDGDVLTAQKFLTSINELNNDNQFTGSRKWELGGTVTYKYVDQDGQVITFGTDRTPVKAFTVSGKVGTKYDLPATPTIAGYGKPTLVSGTENGAIGIGMNEIVYQYEGATSEFTIYRVDTNDKNIVPPEKISGFTNDILDLDDMQLAIAGYDFQELNSTSLSRAVGDFSWQAVPDSFGKQLTLGANAGRSYKFVYAKTAVKNNDSNSSNNSSNSSSTSNTNNSNNNSAGNSSSQSSSTAGTSSSAASSSTDKKNDDNTAKSSSTSTTNDPTGLPVTGGNSTGTSGIGNTNADTSRSSNTRYIPLSTDSGFNTPTSSIRGNDTKNLPQSGYVVNRVLPVIGAIALAGVIGLYAFSKKRKL